MAFNSATRPAGVFAMQILIAIRCLSDPGSLVSDVLSTAEDSKGRLCGRPNAMVAAPICRPELLCETEVLAFLPAVPCRDPQEPEN